MSKITKIIIILAIVATVIFGLDKFNIISLSNKNTEVKNSEITQCIDAGTEKVTEELKLENFKNINLLIVGNITLKQGKTQKVVAKGNKKVIEKLNTSITENLWKIDFGKECFNNYELDIEITLPEIEMLTIQGAGNMKLADFNNQKKLSALVKGSGNFEFNNFEGITEALMKIEGAGKINFNTDISTLKKINVEISGSGDFTAFPVQLDVANIDILGSGNVEITANKAIEANISGMGEIHYKGKPEITKNIQGLGSLVDAN